MRPLNEMDVLIRHSTILAIARKAKASIQTYLSRHVSARKPFGLDSKARPKASGDLTLVSSDGTGPFPGTSVTAGKELVHVWKVFVSKASSDHGGQADRAGLRKVFARVLTAGPGVVCSESYLVVGPYADESHAKNAVTFLTTRTIRYLVAASLYTQNITRDRFDFVPILSMKRTWTDIDLYALLNLTDDEVRHIETTIRPWGDA